MSIYIHDHGQSAHANQGLTTFDDAFFGNGDVGPTDESGASLRRSAPRLLPSPQHEGPVHIYIYIYIERKRDIYIYMYMYIYIYIFYYLETSAN